MPRFSYKAKDINGISLKGLVEAAGIKHAANLLHEKGYYIVELKESAEKSLLPQIRGTGVSFNDVVYFTRQLSTMITAGLTLVEALGVLQQQINKPGLRKLINQLEDDVRGGKSFAEVIAKHSQIFPPVYLSLIKTGEASGKLDVILGRLADNLEKNRDFRSKIRGVLIYPTIVVTGMVVVTVIVMTVVVPRLTSLYKEFGAALPLPTQILIAVSNFMIHSWFIMLIVSIVTGVLFLKWKQTPGGKHILASLSISLPIFGPLIQKATLVEITRTLAILIDSGVPILTSLEIAQNATGNILYKEAFIESGRKVEKGFPFSNPIIENKLFPPILGQMIAVGEQTGKLGDSLFKLSRYFETEADSAVRSLTTMIEPLIMVVLGLGVGFLVMAVLLPIYSLTSKF